MSLPPREEIQRKQLVVESQNDQQRLRLKVSMGRKNVYLIGMKATTEKNKGFFSKVWWYKISLTEFK